MRLINVDTLELEFFEEDSAPKYAILSHTWGDEETSLQEWTNQKKIKKYRAERGENVDDALLELLGLSSAENRSGFRKIINFCEQVKKTPMRYAWTDTCCIDKSSSAELSEAINSMYRWYEKSEACFVYLSDVPPGDDYEGEHSAFRRSRWFTRGWTLQELLAPRDIHFMDSNWNTLFSYSRFENVYPDHSVMRLIEDVTGISIGFLLKERDSPKPTVAQKMAWAANRQTTRLEDRAYSLLGLFGVNMPLLYGEGSKAFSRLQQEILNQLEDRSLLCWGFSLPLVDDRGGLFAPSPDNFLGCEKVTSRSRIFGVRGILEDQNIRQSRFPSHMTNRGLQTQMVFCRGESYRGKAVNIALLDCDLLGDYFLALPVGLRDEGLPEEGDQVWRMGGAPPVAVSYDAFRRELRGDLLTVFLTTEPNSWHGRTQSLSYEDVYSFQAFAVYMQDPEFHLAEVWPPTSWDNAIQTFTDPFVPDTEMTMLLRYTRGKSLRCAETMCYVAIQSRLVRSPQGIRQMVRLNSESWWEISQGHVSIASLVLSSSIRTVLKDIFDCLGSESSPSAFTNTSIVDLGRRLSWQRPPVLQGDPGGRTTMIEKTWDESGFIPEQTCFYVSTVPSKDQ